MGIDCPVTAFLGKDDPEALENEMRDWANVTTGFFEMRHFQGGHFYFMDDVSQGVVPIDTDRRAWREDVGRTMLWLAKEADEVHRVFCGLGQRIK